jgi:hypothetical protein
MYVNLDAVSLFGGANDDQVAASSRGFTSKIEKKTKKYLDELDKYFLDHKIDSRIDLLMEDAPRITRTSWNISMKVSTITFPVECLHLSAKSVPPKPSNMNGHHNLTRPDTVCDTGEYDILTSRITVQVTRPL